MEVVNRYATLSAAIRAGSKLHPQGFGAYLQDGRTCALGAAREAMQLPTTIAMLEFFPYMLGRAQLIPCPTECAVAESCISTMCVHLNDEHQWTREAIADFVEAWENEHLGYETLTESEVTTSEPTTALLLQQKAALQG